ncbi:MAG: hypothetical protein KJ970_05720 [Candidatus Eisenbacteria bacterium]|uniref:Carboxypeptidase regulatory-like domain-containing protein n=1 Tax=Eiseniibacteriota bacterium TaxID=2212470 RepID=A0A948RVT0_UNCEI|nr:hypothetical protein [Candidatus Eisenbacteria bacterium]MBU1949334.1 hypothetical protein [Candidatus Eisenbacteria bacterium]MBU2690407.1 hypothetical protein [Candidatus Eisenbacteria bacterium]
MKLNGNMIALKVLLVLVLAAIMATPLLADISEATINLGREPEPPFCVENPGGQVEISWEITYSTTPNYVLFELWDPTQTILLDTETYPGATGMSITRYWTVPNSLLDGKYWIRLEYWSFEAGDEAIAEVTFYVCNGTGTICAEKYEDTDCNEILTDVDLPIPGWWVCIETPYGDQFCRMTDNSGRFCWEGLLLGEYIVSEIMPPDWEPIYPESQIINLEWGETETVTFFNALCNEPTPTRESTWGQIKRLYE